jgi:hypothetical protein
VRIGSLDRPTGRSGPRACNDVAAAARIAAGLQGAPAAAPLFRRAVAALRELEDPFDLAIVLAEQAETLPERGVTRAAGRGPDDL